MKKNLNIKNIIISIMIVVASVLSMTVVADKMSDPRTHKETIEMLTTKQNQVLALAAASSAASTALSMLPDDSAGPIADEIAEITSYLFIITCVIFVEKFVLTLSGLFVFRVLVPVAGALIILYLFTQNKSSINYAIKVLILGCLTMVIVPTSVLVTDIIEDTHEIHYEQVEDTSISSPSDKTGLFGLLEGITQTVTNLPEKAKNLMGEFIDTIAVFLVTSCIIPLGVLLAYFGVAKAVFKFEFTVNDVRNEIRHHSHKARHNTRDMIKGVHNDQRSLENQYD